MVGRASAWPCHWLLRAPRLRAAERTFTQRKPPGAYAPGSLSLTGPVTGQPLTVRPIDRAVPSMIFWAASIEVALRSGILVCAISRT